MQSLPSVLGSGSGIEVPLFISSLGCFSLNKLSQSLFMSLSVPLCFHTYKSFKSKISAVEKWEVTLFYGWHWVKNLPAIAGDRRHMGSIPRSGRSPGGGHGNPLHYSCLENPMDLVGIPEEPGGFTVHGVTKSQTLLKWLSIQAYMSTLNIVVSYLYSTNIY